MLRSVGHTQSLEELATTGASGLAPRAGTKRQRQLDVLAGREEWDEIVGLESDTNPVGPDSCSRTIIEVVHGNTVDHDDPIVWTEEPGDQRQEC